jgi:hypothetical protein
VAEFTKYTCNKNVEAKPMTLGEYNLYKKWAIPKLENPDDEGYLVVYNANTFEHHESWSPKKTFDGGYSKMNNFKRMPENNHIEANLADKRMTGDFETSGSIYPKVLPETIAELMNSVKYDVHVIENTSTTSATAILVLTTNDTEFYFTLCTEQTSCIDPRNFNREKGEFYAVKKAAESARDKLWELEGYTAFKELHRLG